MSSQIQNSVTESRYYMWRCIAALSAVDGKVTEEETKLVQSYINNLPLSDDQRKGIAHEWADPSTPEELFEKIVDPKDRSQFIYYARLLFWSDGDFDSQEREVLKAFHKDVMSSLDLAAIMRSVDDELNAFNLEQEKVKDNRSFGRKLVDALIFWDRD